MEDIARVLVIGAGIGGCSAIVNLRSVLKSSAEIILVEPKDHCEIYWAAYRSPFEGWVADASLKRLDEGWTEKYNVKHIRSTVTELGENQATLQNGETVAFDVAIVATGANTRAPLLGRDLPTGDYDGSKTNRLAHMKDCGEKLLQAKSVVIVGGGLIGTELAGDIAGYAKQKGQSTPKVSLVHSGSYLSNADLPEKTGKVIQQKLEKLGVTVILNEKAEAKDKMVTLTNSGKTLDGEVDEIVYTTGIEPRNNFLKAGYPEALNDKGWIDTDEYFRIKGGKGKLFAIGDCSTFLPNAGYQILDNGKALASNVATTLLAIRGPDGKANESGAVPAETDLKKGAASMQTTANTVGPKDGVFYSPYFSTQWFLPRLKNSTMFFFRIKQELKL